MDMCKTAKKNVIGVIQRARDSQWKLGFIKEPLYTTQNGSTDQSASNKWTTSAFHVSGKRCSTEVEGMICIIFITDILF